MLGQIFKGAFLIGILAWYSTTVWKMIDGYFKDQFRSYLEEEYRKNPRMKSDVRSAVHSADNKPQPVQTSGIPEAQVHKIVEACNLEETCPAEAVENVERSEGNQPAEREEDLEKEKPLESGEGVKKMSKEKEVTGSTSENEAEEGSVDKNAFLETASEPGLESRKPRDALQEGRSSRRRNVAEERKSEVSDGRAASAERTAGKTPGKRSGRGGPSSFSKQGKKRRVKTITLTEADFALARKTVVPDDEFWEFEEDSEERAPPEGTLVSELPFKPRLDIGDLERVTGEEYCPLSLDEDSSCGESTKWP